MTIYEDTGIVISVCSSVFSPGGSVFLLNITESVSGYSHTIDADGGYRSAQISFDASQAEAEEWFESGLMRHVVVYNRAASVLWEGFVNKVSLSIGGLQIARGPVMDTTNRVLVTYSPLDTSVSPPTAGSETNTAYADDIVAQARYGILEKRLTGGQVTAATALQVRNSYLADNSVPAVTQTFSLEGSSTPSVTLDLAGYGEYLGRFVYNVMSVSIGTVTAKLQAVLVAQPNSLFSTDYTQMYTNAIVQPTGQVKDQSGWDVIKELVALGNSSYDRCTFGIYAGRKAVYAAEPAVFAYQTRLSDSTIELYGGGEIPPWEVRPARWLFYTDFLPGRGLPPVGSFRDDPRAEFIESVVYTAPFGLSLPGGKTDKLSQRMAQMGLAGI